MHCLPLPAALPAPPAGADHLVLADMGCRNTVFNASAQTGLPYLPRMAAAGYGCFRRAGGLGVEGRAAGEGCMAAPAWLRLQQCRPCSTQSA